MNMFLDSVQDQVHELYELDKIVECGELVRCKKNGRPFIQEEIESTWYWVKDCNGQVFKMMVTPCMMWAYKLVNENDAHEILEDFFIHQAVVLNELMCKIFGVEEFNDNDELRCCTLEDVKKVWQYALKKYPYKGKFEIGHDSWMFGK